MLSIRHHGGDIVEICELDSYKCYLLFLMFAFPTDRTVTMPIEPIIAACIVVFLTLCFGLIARRKRIMKVSKYLSYVGN